MEKGAKLNHEWLRTVCSSGSMLMLPCESGMMTLLAGYFTDRQMDRETVRVKTGPASLCWGLEDNVCAVIRA